MSEQTAGEERVEYRMVPDRAQRIFRERRYAEEAVEYARRLEPSWGRQIQSRRVITTPWEPVGGTDEQ